MSRSRRTKERSRLGWVAALSATALLLAGCGSDDAEEPEGEEPDEGADEAITGEKVEIAASE